MKPGEIIQMRSLLLMLLIAGGLLLVSFACGGGSEGQQEGEEAVLPTPMVLIDTPTPLPTNSMSFARGTHTATLLNDGRLLIAGGDDGSGRLEAITDSAELYDPTNGRWEPVEVLGRQRTQHAALLLNDGRGRFSDAPAERLPDGDRDHFTVQVVDLDGDGDIDILAPLTRLRGAPGDYRVLLNDGAGAFSVAQPGGVLPRSAGGNGFDIEVADFDGDGGADLFLCNRASSRAPGAAAAAGGQPRLLLRRAGQ